MKKKFYLSVLLMLTILSTYGCISSISGDPIVASANKITKDFNTEDFQQVESNIPAQIYIVQSDNYSVSAYGPDNQIPLLKIFVKGNTLYLNADKSWNQKIKSGKKQISIHISVPNLTAITHNGVGDIQLNKHAEFDNLTIKLKGVGDVLCEDMACKQLEVNLTGVGDVKLKGNSESAYYKNSGVGDIEAKEMAVSSLAVKHSGVGDVACRAVKELAINASGVGDVVYYGNPTLKDVHKSSVGKIKHK